MLIVDGIEELESTRPSEFLAWARNTPCGVVLTGRDAEPDGFETVRVLGTAPSEARRRLEGLLTAREADPDRLLGLTLRRVARAFGTASGHVVSGESTDVRTKPRDAGVYDVPAFLDAAVDAGLLCPAGDGIYHFVHPLIREHLAAVTPTSFMN
ncbi:hypothetical protein GCM10027203_04960 [Nonomuraea fastidiosa]|uniref:hypothetical protein n=1 Tax=Nonomuraea sp. NPDC052634 TaxID=3155813 RepID=UPI00343DE41F